MGDEIDDVCHHDAEEGRPKDASAIEIPAEGAVLPRIELLHFLFHLLEDEPAFPVVLHPAVNERLDERDAHLVKEDPILPGILFLDGGQVMDGEADQGDTDIVFISSKGHLLLDGLIRPSDRVEIEGIRQIENLFHLAKRGVDEIVVLIERLLRNLKVLFFQERRPISHRMDRQILIRLHVMNILEGTDGVDGEDVAVTDRLVLPVFVMIDVVCHDQIEIFPALQLGKEFLQGLRFEEVVGIDHLEIFSRRQSEGMIDASAVAGVLLMDGPDDRRILLFKPVGDLARGILASVVDDDDLDIFATDEKR